MNLKKQSLLKELLEKENNKTKEELIDELKKYRIEINKKEAFYNELNILFRTKNSKKTNDCQ